MQMHCQKPELETKRACYLKIYIRNFRIDKDICFGRCCNASDIHSMITKQIKQNCNF